MANVTDIMITTFFDDDAIEYIKEKTGINLEKIDDNCKPNGRIVSFDIYMVCTKCIGENKINQLIKAFREAQWIHPEYAVLFIDDDNDVINDKITLDKF